MPDDWIVRERTPYYKVPDRPDYVEAFYDEFYEPEVRRYIVGFAGLDPCRRETGGGSGSGNGCNCDCNHEIDVDGGDIGNEPTTGDIEVKVDGGDIGV